MAVIKAASPLIRHAN